MEKFKSTQLRCKIADWRKNKLKPVNEKIRRYLRIYDGADKISEYLVELVANGSSSNNISLSLDELKCDLLDLLQDYRNTFMDVSASLDLESAITEKIDHIVSKSKLIEKKDIAALTEEILVVSKKLDQILKIISLEFDNLGKKLNTEDSKILRQANLGKISNHLYHGIDLVHAHSALTNELLEARTTQRYWEDGKRRKEDAPDYDASFWMKGFSLTRDIEYAKGWSGVVFIFDKEKLTQKFKLQPFNWGFHISGKYGSQKQHKKEREEFLIFKKTGERFKNAPVYEGEVETNDLEKFEEPDGILWLEPVLEGILIADYILEIYGIDNAHVQAILQHPKFLGVYTK